MDVYEEWDVVGVGANEICFVYTNAHQWYAVVEKLFDCFVCCVVEQLPCNVRLSGYSVSFGSQLSVVSFQVCDPSGSGWGVGASHFIPFHVQEA